jgi:hypothetical protein
MTAMGGKIDCTVLPINGGKSIPQLIQLRIHELNHAGGTHLLKGHACVLLDIRPILTQSVYRFPGRLRITALLRFRVLWPIFHSFGQLFLLVLRIATNFQ